MTRPYTCTSSCVSKHGSLNSVQWKSLEFVALG